MAMLRWTHSRNVDATDEQGTAVKICLIIIEHENGVEQRHAIPEEKIRANGEGIIESEAYLAAERHYTH